MAIKQLWNNGWEFMERPLGTPSEEMLREQDGWKTVDLPHDWLIYDAKDLYRDGEGWYRKRFTYVAKNASQDEVSRVFVRFDGVYMNCTVYLNGAVVYDWRNGYSTFEFDITDELLCGENTMYVQVRFQCPNSRWYSGAGIYRNVWLLTRPQTHLAADGVYVHTMEHNGDFLVTVTAEAEAGAGTNLGTLSVADTAGAGRKRALVAAGELGGVWVRQSIVSPEGDVVAEGNGAPLTGAFATDRQELVVRTPKRWDIECSVLYTLCTELVRDGVVIDRQRQQIGFRTISFDTERGFFLNGRHVKLHGACLHHDLGSLGAAFSKAAQRRQFEKLRKMGVNAVRTSHNMPAKEFMELADEMGFLVVSESFDMWERHKTPYDYAGFFKEWYRVDVASWIRRDRNHPSVILWSIGNEIYDTHADDHGQEITKLLMKEVALHDPLVNAPMTIGSNFMPWENARKCADIVKFAGYNYGEAYYEKHHSEHPDWFIYGSETASTVQSRGIYHFPLEQPVLSDDDEQCSALGNSTTSWGAKSTEHCIFMDRDATYSLGQFIWSGFDYIGEPTPYHAKNSYFGQIDTAGFFKDSAYIYQAEWTDYKQAPMVHVFPYWDFSVGQTVDVRVCSNAPRVELFVNGVSQGTYDIDHEKDTKLVGHWKVPYTPGELTAVAYDENGVEIARETEHSFGDPAKILLQPESTTLAADGTDLLFVEIGMADKDGYPVKNARNRVQVSVEGAARLVGLDNGDSTDYDSYKATGRRLFSGKLLAVLAAKTEPGEIVIRVSSAGLPEERLVLQAVPCEVPMGVAASEDNTAAEEEWLAKCEERERMLPAEGEERKKTETVAEWKIRMAEEIPVRRIDISCEAADETGKVIGAFAGNQLTSEYRTVLLTAKLYPENATYPEILWRVTNNGGVDSNIAKLTDIETGASSTSKPEGLAYGNRVLLTALGDGEVRVRCNTKNGDTKIRLISDRDFVIEGVGTAYLNPYELVSGSLYSRCQGTVTNGNERGVATAREGNTTVTFDGVDFGDFGADELTLPIFELESRVSPIEIWEGAPGDEGSELIDTVIYHVPSQWNTYQEQTYTLPRRLKGITSISFVTDHKMHIKGFVFTKKEKAFERLSAKDNTSVYGDTFTVEEDAITGIGNNVTLVFEEMDFGEQGTASVTICGRSRLPKNTIHVRFHGESGDINEIAEFTGTDEYVEQTFPLTRVKGKNTVNFVFLPGCDFDFQWFLFHH